MEPWEAGLLFSVVIGATFTPAFQQCLEVYARLPKIRYPKGVVRNISPEVTGLIERVIFTCLVGLGVPATVPAMIAWMAAKMAANWNSAEVSGMTVAPREIITRRFSALLTGMVSLAIAAVGGAIWNEMIPLERPQFRAGLALAIVGAVARLIFWYVRPTVVVEK